MMMMSVSHLPVQLVHVDAVEPSAELGGAAAHLHQVLGVDALDVAALQGITAQNKSNHNRSG